MGRKVTVTRSYSHRTLFGGRVTRRVTTTSGGTRMTSRQPTTLVHLSGADLLELQRRQQERIDTLTTAGPQQHATAMANLNAAARWLHTPVGALVLGVATLVGWALLALGAPVLIGVVVALAIVDWHNLTTLHGGINWPLFHERHPRGYWWAVAGMVVYGWVALSAIYAVQAWLAAPKLREAEHAQTQQRIAALERELGLPPSNAGK